MTVKRFAK